MRIPEYPPTRTCPSCGADLNDDDTVYEVENNYWVCADCCLQYITDNYLVDDIATGMDISKKTSWECVADE